MTAVNIVQRPGEVLVMTDGLRTLRSGASGHPCAKVSILPHIPLLVAVRGWTCLPHLMTARFASDGVGATFDDFLKFVPSFAQEVIPQLNAKFGEVAPAEFYIVGFSDERSRLETWKMASTDAYAARGQHPFELCFEEEPMTAAPRPSDEAIKAARFVCPTARKYDPLDHGLKMMDAQRRTCPDAIGEFLQLSRVTKEGISSHVIHRWPDTVGNGMAR
jgi:hypothetical protein